MKRIYDIIITGLLYLVARVCSANIGVPAAAGHPQYSGTFIPTSGM